MRQYNRTPFANLTSDQRKQLGRSAAFGLLGLLLGLFIAWVVWPVEGQDSTLDNLRPELRAHYLSALADTYVSTGGENAESTLSRLNDFSDPEAELAAAIRFYQEEDSSTAALREINLRSLASAFQTSDGNVESMDAPSDQEASVAAPPMGWLNWLWVLLAAVILVGGGLWIFYQYVLGQEHGPQPTGNDDREEDDWDEDDPDEDEYDEEEDEVVNGAVGGGWDNDINVAEEDDSDEDEDEDIDPRGGQNELSHEEQKDFWDNRSTQASPSPAYLTRKYGAETEIPRAVSDRHTDWPTPSDTPQADADGPEDEQPRSHQDDSIVEGEFKEIEAASDEAPVVEDEAATLEDEADVLEDEAHEHEADITGDVEADDSPGETPSYSIVPPLPGPATYESLKNKPKKPRGERRGRSLDENGFVGQFQERMNQFRRKESDDKRRDILAEVTARYHHGITDYDESFTITAPGNAADILGACGMGTKGELDPPSASSDSVRVLDIWLYDKAKLRTQNQLLVGPGVDLDRLADRGVSSGTVTGEPLRVQPGLTFKLRGEHLILDCKIDAVSYLNDEKDAPFSSVIVSMIVRSRPQ